MTEQPRRGNRNGWPALAYGTAWITSSAGGTWTCERCGQRYRTPTGDRDLSDEERDEQAARLHAWTKEHRHG